MILAVVAAALVFVVTKILASSGEIGVGGMDRDPLSIPDFHKQK